MYINQYVYKKYLYMTKLNLVEIPDLEKQPL